MAGRPAAWHGVNVRSAAAGRRTATRAAARSSSRKDCRVRPDIRRSSGRRSRTRRSRSGPATGCLDSGGCNRVRAAEVVGHRLLDQRAHCVPVRRLGRPRQRALDPVGAVERVGREVAVGPLDLLRDEVAEVVRVDEDPVRRIARAVPGRRRLEVDREPVAMRRAAGSCTATAATRRRPRAPRSCPTSRGSFAADVGLRHADAGAEAGAEAVRGLGRRAVPRPAR
jgi:hypothetical protein